MKKILSVALCALFIGGVSSCKDYEDEIRNDVNQALSTTKADFDKKISDVNATITSIQSQAALMKTWIDQNTSHIILLEVDVDILKEQFEALQANYDTLKYGFDSLSVEYNEFKTSVDSIQNALLNKLAEVEEIAVTNSIDIADLKAQVAGMGAKYQEALAAVDALRSQLNHEIYGVQVQAVTCPVLGDVNVNFAGIESTFLCSYFGKNVEMTEEFYGVNLGETKMLSNAGSIYFTLNPVGNDFAGHQLKLIDSYGNQAPVSLTSALAKPDYQVQSGVSRAADNAYLYKTTAWYPSVKKAEENQIDYSSLVKKLGGDIKAVIKNKTATDLQTLVKDFIYEAAKNTDVPAYGLAAEYTVNGQKKTVVSKYNLQIQSIKPLSFGLNVEEALKDINFHRSIPSILETLDKIKGKLDLNGIIADVNVGTFDLSGIKITGTVTVGGTPKTVEINTDDLTTTNLTSVIAQEIAKMLNTDNTGVIAQIEKSLTDKIAAKIDAVKDNKYTHAADKIVSFLNKTIEKVATRIDNANYYLQPIMFFGNKEVGYHHLATKKEFAPISRGEALPLYATTYTNDILNPAIFKAVTVKNLTTGEVVAKDVDGKTLGVAFDGYQRGLTVMVPSDGLYEITYAAVDYFGKVVEINYYINVER